MWLKWGFRVKYPPFLGDAPLKRDRWAGKGANTNPGQRPVMVVPGNPVGAAEMQVEPRSELDSPEVTHYGQEQKGFHVTSV